MPLGKRKYGAYGSKYRSRVNRRRRFPSVKYKVTRRAPSRAKFARRVMSVVNRKAETKKIFKNCTGGSGSQTQLNHNNVTLIQFNALQSVIGVRGEAMDTGSGGMATRVGKKIFLKGLSCAINLESIQKRPSVTYWLALMRNKKDPYSNLDTKGDIFEGLNSTIPMDYIDTDKVEVKFMKKMTLRMPNAGTSSSMAASGFAPTWDNDGDPVGKFVVTNPQKIMKFWVPFNKTIEYNDYDPDANAGQRPHPKDMWQWVAWSYDTHGTPDTGADSETGRLELSTVMKFTDV